jgi:alkyldihydroxyacetonephosphate synthase
MGRSDRGGPVAAPRPGLPGGPAGARDAAPGLFAGGSLARIPPSRLPDHPQVHTNPELRLRHAVGQGLPDWIAARSGRIQAPDGVAFPETNEDVRALLAYARAVGARVIPYGGGTSVVGHLRVLPDPRPALAIDLGRMNRLLALDRLSGLATFQTGIRGPDLEAAPAGPRLHPGALPAVL